MYTLDGPAYKCKISPYITTVICNTNLSLKVTYNKLNTVVSSLIAFDLADKRPLKFTTTLNSLEPQEIEGICETTALTPKYVKSLLHTVFYHTYDVIHYEHFWSILKSLEHPIAIEKECGLHRRLYESFLYDDKPMTILSFILAVSVLQDKHHDIIFIEHCIEHITLSDILEGLNTHNTHYTVHIDMLESLSFDEIHDIYVSLFYLPCRSPHINSYAILL